MNYVIGKNDSEIINKLKAVFILLVVLIHTRAYTGKGYVNMTGGEIDLSTPISRQLLLMWQFQDFLLSRVCYYTRKISSGKQIP